MYKEILKEHTFILASKSPRRHELLKAMEIDFEIRLREIEEIFDPKLQGPEVTDYLAQLKAQPFQGDIKDKEILLTSDTIVWLHGEALGKPKDRNHAIEMLQKLSGKSHQVYTSICLTTTQKQLVKHARTDVYFKTLSLKEIEHYIDHYQVYDKAGSYAVQEGIGLSHINRMDGTYYNVMGLPVHLLPEMIVEITK